MKSHHEAANSATRPSYQLTEQHVEALQALGVAALTPERYFLHTRTGDKTPTRQALRGYFTKM